MTYYLGVDVGGSASRWTVVDETGNVAAQGLAEGATGLIYDAASLAAFTGVLEEIRDAMPGAAAAAHFGITGVGFSPHAEVEKEVSGVLGLPRHKFGYSNDMVLAWRAAFRDQSGYLISAGTGSIGISIDPDGQATIVGGRGILVDDGGSGAWIALRALDSLFRIIDDHGSPKGATILADALFASVGGGDRDSMRAYIYGKGRGRIGILAQAVAEAAAKGDPLALSIVEQAGRELTRLARALLRRKGPAPISFIGGVFALHPCIRAEIERELAAETISFPKIDAASHAAQIAYEMEYPAK